MKLSAHFIISCCAAVLASAGTAAHIRGAASTWIPSAGFAADGWVVKHTVTFNGQVPGTGAPSSGVGILAVNSNVTLYSTGQPKPMLWLQGDAYARGHCAGQLTAHDAWNMSTNYINNIIPDLISAGLTRRLGNSTLVEAILEALGNMITRDAVTSFNQQLDAFPDWLVHEMHGIADGANTVLPASQNITVDRIITLNYGFDYLSAHMFTGHIMDMIFPHLQRSALLQPGDAERIMAVVQPRDFVPPSYCDAFAVKESATASGKDVFFARDLQLPTGGVFQDLAYHSVYIPTEPGQLPVVVVNGPGFVGAITAMNHAGFAAGVDTLRSGFINWTAPGINSILAVRTMGQTATSAEDATNIMAGLHRGVTFMYPMADASGDFRVLEAGAWQPTDDIPDFTAMLNNSKLIEAMPSAAWLAANLPVPDYRAGLFVRHASDRVPAAFIAEWQPKLWALSGLPYNASAWEDGQSLWPSWEAEDDAWYKVGAQYFPPTRLPPGDDMIVLSNNALTPQLHISQMTFWSEVYPGESIQWRYDQLASRVLAFKQSGGMTWDDVLHTILFLSPEQSPGYWKVALDPSDPGSTVVEGAISAMDLRLQVIHTKTGYFGDGWTQVTLPLYVPPSAQ